MSDKKLTNAEGMKVQHIIEMTEAKVGKLTAEEIFSILKNIPEQHGPALEAAVQVRNTKEIGQLILMSIYQVAQDEIKKAVYQ